MSGHREAAIVATVFPQYSDISNYRIALCGPVTDTDDTLNQTERETLSLNITEIFLGLTAYLHELLLKYLRQGLFIGYI